MLPWHRIPKRVVHHIENKTGPLQVEGTLLLLDGQHTQMESTLKKTHDDRIAIHGGFRAYANTTRLNVDDVVAICFEKDGDTSAMKVWITVIA